MPHEIASGCELLALSRLPLTQQILKITGILSPPQDLTTYLQFRWTRLALVVQQSTQSPSFEQPVIQSTCLLFATSY